MEKKEFVNAVKEMVKPYGYKRHSSFFYKDYGEYIIKVWVQRSDFSVLYYLNIHLTIKALNEEKNYLRLFPYDYVCRIRHQSEGEKRRNDMFDMEEYDDETILRYLHDSDLCELIEAVENGGIESLIALRSYSLVNYRLREYLKKEGYTIDSV